MSERTAFMITSGLCVAYSLAVVALKVLWPWRGQSPGLLAQLCRHFRRGAPRRPEEAEVEERVREECLKRRSERARTFLTMFSLPSTCFSISTLCCLAIDGETMPLMAMAAVQANLFTKSTAAFFPKLLTPRAIDVMYGQSVLTMVCVTVFAQPAGPASSWRLVTLVQFLFWGLFDLKPWINAVGFLCLFLAEVAAAVWMGAPPQPILPATLALGSALFSLIGIDYCLKRSVRFEILAADSKSELTAVQTLMNSICDVVVLLDGQLQMRQHSPKLADVLLQPASRSFAGADLRDYMASDADSEVFSEHVRMKDGDTAQANVFHARLRDGPSSSVAMEFFAVGFKGHNGEQHHIVGMREHTDIQPLACPWREPQPPPVEVVAPHSNSAEGQSQPQRGAPHSEEPQLQPGDVAMPRGGRVEGQPQPQHGTPYAVEQCDLRSHRSNATVPERPQSKGERSDPGSDSNSELSLHVARATAGLEAQGLASMPPSIETSEIAKIATTNYLLMSWVVKEAQCSCCPMHAAIASLQRVAAALAQKECSPDYGPFTKWQCRRCGIKADEYRDPEQRRSRRCLLCQDLENESFASTAAAGAASNLAL